MISVVGVMIGTAALIIVLSVFNGFETLIVRMYNSFDPDLKISAVRGKSFSLENFPLEKLEQLNGVAFVTRVVEENALVKYRDKQYIITIKGVSDEFPKMTGIDSMLADGQFLLHRGDTDYAVVGGGIAYNLQLNIHDIFSQLEIYAPRKSASSLINPEEAFNRRYLSASGVFSVQQEFDTKYIIVQLRFANEILDYDSRVTFLEVGFKKDATPELLQTQVSALAGSDFMVRNRYQQHELIYKIMKSEKWAVYLILTFILIIATFNVISSLTMLVIEKKKDISILHSMGADSGLLRRIFLTEGLFITGIGAFIGLFLGYIICFIQKQFGIIKLGNGGSFVIDAYPVHMQAMDFLYVVATVFVIGIIAAWYSSRRLIGKKSVISGIKEE